MSGTFVPFEGSTVIWDLDGTVLNSFAVLRDSLQTVLPAYDIVPPTREVLAQNFHGSLEDTIRNSLGDKLDASLLPLIMQDFLVVQDTFYDAIESRLYADALELMRRLHDMGKRQVLVTNRGHVGRLRASPRSIVEQSSLKQFIDMIICGDDSEYRKPDPRVLDNLVLDGLDLKSAIVIGDQVVDAEFAHNLEAGAVVVARNGGISSLEYLKSRHMNVSVVESLTEVQFV